MEELDFFVRPRVVAHRFIEYSEPMRVLLLDKTVDRDADLDLVAEDVAALAPAIFTGRSGIALQIKNPKLVELTLGYRPEPIETVFVEKRRITDKSGAPDGASSS